MASKAALLIGALAIGTGVRFDSNGNWHIPGRKWKPKFTDDELEHGRSLPKRERQKYFAELRYKYFNELEDGK